MDNHVYVGQTALRIQLNTFTDLTSAIASIRFIKPDGISGQWTAEIQNVPRGVIYYDVQTGDIDQEGTWKIWAFIEFDDMTRAPGTPVEFNVYPEGSICP